ncbi:MAG TPA: DUF6526 family protein [Puia sp.]|nr:DUF6526 family protein [Puia sp.]
MPEQNASYHSSYYTAHHFVFYPLLLIALSVSIYKYNQHPDQSEIWGAIIALFIFVGWSSFMMRQHYALGNQDRIVRLELRFRYYVITGKRLEPHESNLSFRQLAALRFASDEELDALVERALKENLSASQIKNLIVRWLPDHMRV